ncbi:MAG TPA: 3-hydroxy-5-phosphonooxypentane-2,4-dione thiolase LsrF, partial [Roseibacterium sp.]|nr:3-hydroxy-5-phosphonooxypentane-2,4-dione thiolase LsrF [Roseibacterium sp.]
KKLPEDEALDMAFRAVDQGAAGVDMGRNIFQSDSPVAMIKAVSRVVHDMLPAAQAFEMYNDLKSDG